MENPEFEPTTDKNIQYADDYVPWGEISDQFSMPKNENIYFEGCTFFATFKHENKKGNDVISSRVHYVGEPKCKSYFYDWLVEKIQGIEAEADYSCGMYTTSIQVIPPHTLSVTR